MSVERPYDFDNRAYTVLPGNRRTEVGCPPFAAIFALGAAVEYALALGVEQIEARVLALNTYLTEPARARGDSRPLSRRTLSLGGDAVRSGGPAAGRRPSFASAASKSPTKPEGLRISTHYYNSESDVDICVRRPGRIRARNPGKRVDRPRHGPCFS